MKRILDLFLVILAGALLLVPALLVALLVRITSKGQVTIPIEIREHLGLLPNSEVEFEVEGRTRRPPITKGEQNFLCDK